MLAFLIKLLLLMDQACSPPPSLQTFSTAGGATLCQRCSATQWTARLTGQKVCWSTSKRLP